MQSMETKCAQQLWMEEIGVPKLSLSPTSTSDAQVFDSSHQESKPPTKTLSDLDGLGSQLSIALENSEQSDR
jgi:hypothetical protein